MATQLSQHHLLKCLSWPSYLRQLYLPIHLLFQNYTNFCSNFKPNDLEISCSFVKGQVESKEGRNSLVQEPKAIGFPRIWVFIISSVFTY